MLNRFLNILFPESSPLCQRPSTKHKTAPICPDCWDAVRPYNGAICKRCGAPLVSEASLACGQCLKDEPAFTHARCFGLHDGALKKAINLFKFHGIKRLSKPLSEKIFHMELPGADMVLPVPLYKKRLRERGFNQSALLGKYVAKRLGVPLNLSSLVRNRDTRPQVGLSAKERKKNIRRMAAGTERFARAVIIGLLSAFRGGARSHHKDNTRNLHIRFPRTGAGRGRS